MTESAVAEAGEEVSTTSRTALSYTRFDPPVLHPDQREVNFRIRINLSGNRVWFQEDARQDDSWRLSVAGNFTEANNPTLRGARLALLCMRRHAKVNYPPATLTVEIFSDGKAHPAITYELGIPGNPWCIRH